MNEDNKPAKSGVMNQIDVTPTCAAMAEGVIWYEPAPRYGHVAAAVEGKLYVWGGMRRDLPKIHNGRAKTAITSVVDVLDPKVKMY